MDSLKIDEEEAAYQQRLDELLWRFRAEHQCRAAIGDPMAEAWKEATSLLAWALGTDYSPPE